MNPIAQMLLIGFLCLLVAFFFGGLMNLNHAACQADRDENDLGIPPDREFTELAPSAQDISLE